MTGDGSWRLERVEASSKPIAIGRVDTSTSLLIESLLTLICSMWENEPALKNKLYRGCLTNNLTHKIDLMLYKILI